VVIQDSSLSSAALYALNMPLLASPPNQPRARVCVKLNTVKAVIPMGSGNRSGFEPIDVRRVVIAIGSPCETREVDRSGIRCLK